MTCNQKIWLVDASDTADRLDVEYPLAKDALASSSSDELLPDCVVDRAVLLDSVLDDVIEPGSDVARRLRSPVGVNYDGR